MVIRLSLLGILLATSGARAQTSSGHPSEYAVKAAYIYNFAKFVEWPPGILDERGEFIIGMLGDDPFGNVLERALESKMAGGYPISFQRYSTLDEAAKAQILFIPASRELDLPFLPSALHRDAVLTVSDSPGFAERGVLINFFITNDDKVRFEVNLKEAENTGLRLSSQLLKLATIVDPRS
jgi:hypothetical protein